MAEARLQRRRRHLERGHGGLLLAIPALHASSGAGAKREVLRHWQEGNVITMEYAY